MRKSLIVVLLMVWGYGLSQNFKAYIYNEFSQPIAGAQIIGEEFHTVSMQDGSFSVVLSENKTISIWAEGYQKTLFLIDPNQNNGVRLILPLVSQHIDPVDITTKTAGKLPYTLYDTDISEQLKGSLSETLSTISGVNTHLIGSSSGKPILRGFGLDRVVVVSNHLTHESQSWGQDHGLELDAQSLEQVQILKGASSFAYGNGALGGVLKVRNDLPVYESGIHLDLKHWYRSVNDALGANLRFRAREGRIFYKLFASYTNYADYRTTTDQIYYLNRVIPIYGKRVLNTAGRDWNVMGQIGFMSDTYTGTLTVEENRMQAGFFPGAHGVPDLDRLQGDGSYRNVELPKQTAQHIAVKNSNYFDWDTSSFEIHLGYQHNLRAEYSPYHTHYSTPIEQETTISDKELEFNLMTLSGAALWKYPFSDKLYIAMGSQVKWQSNRISGYSYLLPEYNRKSWALHASTTYKPFDKWELEAGLRWDAAHYLMNSYFDEHLYQYLLTEGFDADIALDYGWRTPDLKKKFNNLNWMLGANYTIIPNQYLRMEVASAFRDPSAIELGANGVHHGAFRHERGDARLNSEKGIAAQIEYTYAGKHFSFSLNPYAYHFNNYLYLQPTGIFSVLPHAGQVYQYQQTKAQMYGVESELKYHRNQLEGLINFEFLYHFREADKQKLALPFTPTWNVYSELAYHFPRPKSGKTSHQVRVTARYFAKKDWLAPTEIPTPDSFVFGLGYWIEFPMGKIRPKVSVSVDNLFNKTYYSATSFYRAIHLPEQARNIQIQIQSPIL